VVINKNNNPVWLACGVALGMLIGVSIRTTPVVADQGALAAGNWVVVEMTGAAPSREVVRYNAATGVTQLCNLTTLTCGNALQP
jgi:hypothetical protein